MIAVVGSLFDSSFVYERLAHMATAVAVWASMRTQPQVPASPEEAYRELEARVRFAANHPWQYRVSRIGKRLFREME